MNSFRFSSLLFAAGLLALPLSAGQLALTFPAGSSIPFQRDEGVYGWYIRVDSPVDVVGFGFWDFGQDGLLEDHAVGLWDNTGVLLASAGVAAGDSAPLMDEFRTVSIERFTLLPGLYRVGATATRLGDPLSSLHPMGPEPIMHPSVQFVAAAYQPGPGLIFPALGSEFYGYFGPNLVLEDPAPNPVPEAGGGTALLAGVWLVFATVLVRRVSARIEA